MISYLGFPLLWPSGEVFGTICVLDSKQNHFSEACERFVLQFKELVEAHLELLCDRESLGSVVKQRTAELRKANEQLRHDMAVRMRAEKALRASEGQYRGIFEATTDGLRIGTLDGQTVAVNEAYAQMHGYSPEEIAAVSPRQWIHPDCHYLFQQFIEAVKAGKTFHCEGQDVRKDGSVFDVEVHGIPWNYQGKQHTLTVVRDITERKQLHETLERKQRNLEAIFNAAPVGMMLVNDQMVIKRVNNVVTKFVHRDFSEIINRRGGEGLGCINATDHPDACGHGPSCSACLLRNTVEDVLSSGQPAHEIEVQASLMVDGKQIAPWLEISAEPAFLDGSKHVVLAIYDITERKRAEEEIRTYQGQLRSLASELLITEEKERRQIAIELHDALGQILASSKLKLGTIQKAAHKGSTESLNEIRDLIDEGLQYTRTLTFELSPPVLHSLGLEAAIEWLAEKFQKEHGILCHSEDDEQPKPISDEVSILLFRAVRELLVNVSKHAKACNVKINTCRRDNNMQVTVKDDGLGFDTAAVDQGFGKVSGFGLFSIRERLSHMGGQFELWSNRGRGTRVTLLAPLESKGKTR